MNCPLCGEKLNHQEAFSSSAYPDVPLQFDRRSLTRWLVILSIAVVLLILGLGFLYQGRFPLIQSAVFGIVTMWLAVLIMIRKRRNIAKSLLYLWVFLSLISIYLDYLFGCTNWSITYAIPIICSSVSISMFITNRLTRMQDGDYVLYWVGAEILSLIPLLFIMFSWVEYRLPSLISIGLGLLMLVFMLVKRGPVIWHELKKRTFI